MLEELFNSGIPEYASFSVWFLPINNNARAWMIVDKETGDPVGELAGDVIALTPDSIHGIELIYEEFDKFKDRPEYYLTDTVEDLNMLDQESLQLIYEQKLITVAMIKAARARKDPDTCIKAAESCIQWLRSTDFYSAPASTQYHDSEPSGLLKHSLRVFNHIVRLKYDKSFESVNVESSVLVALVHDWCKIGLYEMYMRNVKNDTTGKWEQVPSYKHNQKGLPLGHGVSSMFFASKFFKLTSEEAAAIRWHMGEYNVAPNECSELHLANESFPLVFLIQFADRLSITKYAN